VLTPTAGVGGRETGLLMLWPLPAHGSCAGDLLPAFPIGACLALAGAVIVLLMLPMMGASQLAEVEPAVSTLPRTAGVHIAAFRPVPCRKARNLVPNWGVGGMTVPESVRPGGRGQ
jgi:hypothetical protein